MVGENPVGTLPAQTAVAQSLAKLDLLVCQELLVLDPELPERLRGGSMDAAAPDIAKVRHGDGGCRVCRKTELLAAYPSTPSTPSQEN